MVSCQKSRVRKNLCVAVFSSQVQHWTNKLHIRKSEGSRPECLAAGIVHHVMLLALLGAVPRQFVVPLHFASESTFWAACGVDWLPFWGAAERDVCIFCFH